MTIRFLVSYIFLTQFVISEPLLSTEVKLRDCSPKEIVIAEGKCSRYVNDLMYLTENYKRDDITLEVAKNISRVCQSITTCFGAIECSGSQINKETYEGKCEKLDYVNYDLDTCLKKFFNSVYMKEFPCSANFDYFSNNMTVKRTAYTAGKSCLMEMTSSCSSKSQAYLNSNYDDLLNVLTTPRNNEKCSSLHDELMKRQCDPIVIELQKCAMLAPFIKVLNSTDECLENTCRDMKNCMSDSCSFTSNITDTVDEFCKISNNDFYGCLLIVRANEKQLQKEHECMGSIEKASPNGGPAYFDDTECMREITTVSCNPLVLKTFDKDMADYQKINATMDSRKTISGLKIV